MQSGPYRHLDYLPEPEDPRMLTAIDPDAPGYPFEDYGVSHEQADIWRNETSNIIRAERPRPLGIIIVLILVSGLLISYPSIVSLFAEALTPDSEWAYEDSNIYALQDIGDGLSGAGVGVCIVDTGIEIGHPAFEHMNLSGYKDFISNDNDNVQDRGIDKHGTMMAGILVSKGRFTGAAPNVDLYVAAALDEDGQTRSESVVATAIRWCWSEMGADIISLSLGGEPNHENPLSSQTASAVSDALDNGVFVVAAAGNSGEEGATDVSVPANVQGVIAVGAVDENRQLWSQTAIGASTEGSDGEERVYPHQKPEVSAPGVGIVSTSDPDKTVAYSESSGTSDSTVFVVGALALILERHGEELTRNGLDNSRDNINLVKGALAESCQRGPNQDTDHHPRYGYGTLDALAWEYAVAAAIADRSDT